MIKNKATPFCGSQSISRNKPLNIHLPYNKGMAMIQIEPFCVPQVGGGRGGQGRDRELFLGNRESSLEKVNACAWCGQVGKSS